MTIPAAPTGYVSDFANILPADRVALLTRIAEDVKAKSGGEIAIVTLADIGDRQASEIALEIGRQWKVGQNDAIGTRSRNAGVVILLVPKETNSSGRGSCRVEVGQGSEGFITDGMSGEICREATPFFREQDYARGLTVVTTRVAQRYAAEFGFALDTTLVPRRRAELSTGDQVNPLVVFIIIMIIIFLISRAGRGGRGGRGGGVAGFVPVILPNLGGGGWGERWRDGAAVAVVAGSEVSAVVAGSAAAAEDRTGDDSGGAGNSGGQRDGRRRTRDSARGALRRRIAGRRAIRVGGGRARCSPASRTRTCLIIVDAVPLEKLLHKAAAVQKWIAAGNPAPLLLTLDEWRSSADIFAMEYADILHRHQVLSGVAPFDGIRVAPSDLRLHVEREGMGKLLQLRRAIMAVGRIRPRSCSCW